MSGRCCRGRGRELFEQTAKLIPRCVLKMHPKRGHITVLSDPRALAEVRGFLSHGMLET
jgi:hypothetical protein